MTGSRVRCIVHDGKRVVDNRPISREFNGMEVLDFTKKIYATQSKQYETKELRGEELTSIEGIRKNDEEGFQVYWTIMKGGEVIEMGLPGVDTSDPKFLSAAQMRLNIDELESRLEHLPEDVEFAIVWRLDKGMTQDIVISENSMVNQSVPTESYDFSLLNDKPPVGCGGGFGGDGEAVYNLTEVFIYTGEKDDPIRMSNVTMAAPPEACSWDCFDNFQYAQPITSFDAVAQQNKRTSNYDSISDFTVQMSWGDEIKHRELTAPVEINYEHMPEKHGDSVLPDTAPTALVLLVCSESQHEIKTHDLSQTVPIDPVLNPTERKVVDVIYATPTPDYFEQNKMPTLATPKYDYSRPTPIDMPTPIKAPTPIQVPNTREEYQVTKTSEPLQVSTPLEIIRRCLSKLQPQTNKSRKFIQPAIKTQTKTPKFSPEKKKKTAKIKTRERLRRPRSPQPKVEPKVDTVLIRKTEQKPKRDASSRIPTLKKLRMPKPLVKALQTKAAKKPPSQYENEPLALNAKKKKLSEKPRQKVYDEEE